MRTRSLLALLVPLVVLFAWPVFGADIVTVKEAPIYEKPDKAAAVLAKVKPSVVLESDETKDFWFHVNAEVDGNKVSGWMYFTDVSNMMGRAKGALLAENKRLLEEVTQLRQKNADMEKRLDAAQKALEEARNQIGELKKQLDDANRR